MTSKPPGFYPDDAGTMRYWDGNDWTDQTKPAPSTDLVKVDQERAWHEKTLWRVCGGVLAVFFVIGSLASGVVIGRALSVGGDSDQEVATDVAGITEQPAQDQPGAAADTEPADQVAATDGESEPQEAEQSLTPEPEEQEAAAPEQGEETESAEEATAAQPAEAETAVPEPVEAEEAQPAEGAAGENPEPVEETTATTTTTTTEAPAADAQEVQQVEWVCGGQTIQIVVAAGDDPADVCNEVLGIVWIDAVFENLPDLAERAGELNAWDTYEASARGFCPAFEGLGTQAEADAAVLTAWGSFDAEMQSSLFPGGQDEFAEFAEVSSAVFCPGTLDALR